MTKKQNIEFLLTKTLNENVVLVKISGVYRVKREFDGSLWHFGYLQFKNLDEAKEYAEQEILKDYEKYLQQN